MKIAVNTRLLLKNKLEGIGWFTYETMKRITQNHPEHQFYFLFDREPHPEFLFSSNITPIVLRPPARHPVLWYIWFELSVARYIKKNNFSLFISPDGIIPLSLKIPTISVIHDINFYHFPKWMPFFNRLYYNHYFPKFATKATKIVTVSDYSKEDISKSFRIDPNKITVAHNGANKAFVPLQDEEIRGAQRDYGNGNPYFIFVGALNPRKNVANLLRAFDLFCSKTKLNYNLVVVGEPMFMTKDINLALNEMKYKKNVIFTGRLQINELRYAMGGASALTFVPFFEGFGIPMVEAMYCHVPIIASNTTSMPEVAGNAALYTDPNDIISIADAMQQMAVNHTLREDLVANTKNRKSIFSWDNTADRLYECIESIIY